MATSDLDMLQSFLEARDIPCPSCGYNLRGLRGERCPECGEAIELRVGMVEPRQSAGIAGLIGLAAGGGMNGLLLGYVLIRMVLFHDMPGPMDAFLVLNISGLVLEGAALLLWVRSWRRVRRLSPGRKLLLVAGCWALTFLNLLLFSVYVK